MKSKILSCIILFAALIILSSDCLKSASNISCPPGFVRVTKHENVFINGISCRYQVDLCVKCPAGTHQQQFTVRLAAITPNPIHCGFDASQARDSIWKIVTDPNWMYDNLRGDCFAGLGPCEHSQNWIPVIYEIPKCWQMMGFRNDENNWVIMYAGCENQICTCKWTGYVCWDSVNQKYYFSPPVSDSNNGQICCDVNIPNEPDKDDENPTPCFDLPCPNL